MNEWLGFCHRCTNTASGHIMSTFNTELVCFKCYETEKKRPDYERARQAEMDAVRRGDHNFPGVGLRS